MKHFKILCLGLFACTIYAQKQPNILVINIDDMGWKDVGFMGSKYYNTPHIDALAKQGMVFTQGYAGASNCAPSRASMLTGKWTTRHQIYTVGTSARGKAKDRNLIPVKNTEVLHPKFQTIATLLQKKGYSTCAAGKWHIGNNPLNYGFEVNIGGGSNGHPSSYYPPYKNVTLKNTGKKHLTDAVMDEVLDFLDIQNDARPFFLYYAPYAVHTPIQAVSKLLPKYENKATDKGQNNPTYATMVENLDRNVGRLVHRLKTKKLFDNTLIVFTSDNGGLYGITDQKPLRAGKGAYYEGGIRVPFFFVWKNQIPVGINRKERITHLDLFPTLLAAAGIVAPKRNYDGANLLNLLKAKTPKLKERALFWHFPVYLEAYKKNNLENRDVIFRTRPGSVIIKGDWKLHYYFEDQGVELYHLRSDVGEQQNVAATKSDKKEELLNDLKKWWKTTKAPMPKRK